MYHQSSAAAALPAGIVTAECFSTKPLHSHWRFHLMYRFFMFCTFLKQITQSFFGCVAYWIVRKISCFKRRYTYSVFRFLKERVLHMLYSFSRLRLLFYSGSLLSTVLLCFFSGVNEICIDRLYYYCYWKSGRIKHRSNFGLITIGESELKWHFTSNIPLIRDQQINLFRL